MHEVQSVLCVPACHVLQPPGNCALCTGMSGWARFRQEKRFVVQNPRIIGSYPGDVQIMKFVAVAASVWKWFMKKTCPADRLSCICLKRDSIHFLFDCVDIFDIVTTVVVSRECIVKLNILSWRKCSFFALAGFFYVSISHHSHHIVTRIVKKNGSTLTN